LKPGTYVCQVNVIDDAGGSFSFPRLALMVQAAATIPMTTPTGGAATGAPGPVSQIVGAARTASKVD
jgi:hypothetical protein